MAIISAMLGSIKAILISLVVGLVIGVLCTGWHYSKSIDAINAKQATELAAANAKSATQTQMNNTVADIYNKSFKDQSNANDAKAAQIDTKLVNHTVIMRMPVDSCQSNSVLSGSSDSKGTSSGATAELTPEAATVLTGIATDSDNRAIQINNLLEALKKQGVQVQK